MTYRGQMKNGVVILDGSPRLRDGTVVRVEPVRAKRGTRKKPGTIWDKLLKIAGTAKGLPADLAKNHDHYLYGRPKRP